MQPPTSVVERLRPTDCLLGRGRHIEQYPGNILFRDRIREFVPDYREAQRRGFARRELTQRVIRNVMSFFQNRVGMRFLSCLDKNLGLWILASQEMIRKKVGQQLRYQLMIADEPNNVQLGERADEEGHYHYNNEDNDMNNEDGNEEGGGGGGEQNGCNGDNVQFREREEQAREESEDDREEEKENDEGNQRNGDEDWDESKINISEEEKWAHEEHGDEIVGVDDVEEDEEEQEEREEEWCEARKE